MSDTATMTETDIESVEGQVNDLTLDTLNADEMEQFQEEANRRRERFQISISNAYDSIEYSKKRILDYQASLLTIEKDIESDMLKLFKLIRILKDANQVYEFWKGSGLLVIDFGKLTRTQVKMELKRISKLVGSFKAPIRDALTDREGKKGIQVEMYCRRYPLLVKFVVPPAKGKSEGGCKLVKRISYDVVCSTGL